MSPGSQSLGTRCKSCARRTRPQCQVEEEPGERRGCELSSKPRCRTRSCDRNKEGRYGSGQMSAVAAAVTDAPHSVSLQDLVTSTWVLCQRPGRGQVCQQHSRPMAGGGTKPAKAVDTCSVLALTCEFTGLSSPGPVPFLLPPPHIFFLLIILAASCHLRAH